MDWFRRNWPDLIIAVALIAVIAGIVATLLSGGSFLSFGGQAGVGNGAGAEQPPAAQAPQNPDASESSSDNAGGIEPVVPDLPGETTGSGANAGAADNPQTSGEAPNGPDPLADSPEQAAPAESGDVVAVVPDETSPGDESPGEASPEESAAGNLTGEPAEAIEGASYRVSVGAFASREGAEGVAESYSERGFPAFVASQGDLSLALVGPYATEEEANRIAQQIIEDGGEALVYPYEPTDEPAAQDSSGEGAPEAVDSGSGPDTSSGTPSSASPSSSDDLTQLSGTFLQVGAFGSGDAALPRREQIEELGYRTSERDTGTGLTRLFVGPLGPTEVGEVQTRLEALGIDSFPVSLP